MIRISAFKGGTHKLMHRVFAVALACLGVLVLSGCQQERTVPTQAEKEAMELRKQQMEKTMKGRPGGFAQPAAPR
jgi:hypothetical protein